MLTGFCVPARHVTSPFLSTRIWVDFVERWTPSARKEIWCSPSPKVKALIHALELKQGNDETIPLLIEHNCCKNILKWIKVTTKSFHRISSLLAWLLPLFLFWEHKDAVKTSYLSWHWRITAIHSLGKHYPPSPASWHGYSSYYISTHAQSSIKIYPGLLEAHLPNKKQILHEYLYTWKYLSASLCLLFWLKSRLKKLI